MIERFHVTPDGKVARCTAEQGGCPYGAEDHSDTVDGASERRDVKMREEYGSGLQSVTRSGDSSGRASIVTDAQGRKTVTRDGAVLVEDTTRSVHDDFVTAIKTGRITPDDARATSKEIAGIAYQVDSQESVARAQSIAEFHYRVLTPDAKDSDIENIRRMNALERKRVADSFRSTSDVLLKYASGDQEYVSNETLEGGGSVGQQDHRESIERLRSFSDDAVRAVREGRIDRATAERAVRDLNREAFELETTAETYGNIARAQLSLRSGVPQSYVDETAFHAENLRRFRAACFRNAANALQEELSKR